MAGKNRTLGAIIVGRKKSNKSWAAAGPESRWLFETLIAPKCYASVTDTPYGLPTFPSPTHTHTHTHTLRNLIAWLVAVRALYATRFCSDTLPGPFGALCNLRKNAKDCFNYASGWQSVWQGCRVAGLCSTAKIAIKFITGSDWSFLFPRTTCWALNYHWHDEGSLLEYEYLSAMRCQDNSSQSA